MLGDLIGLEPALASAVDATHLREACNTLRWTCGHVVQLAASNSEYLVQKCPDLNADKLAHARAVASRNTCQARELAWHVFYDRASLVFLY